MGLGGYAIAHTHDILNKKWDGNTTMAKMCGTSTPLPEHTFLNWGGGGEMEGKSCVWRKKLFTGVASKKLGKIGEQERS